MARTVKELLPRAQGISRRLAKAALRLEAFASFLRGQLAVNSGRSFPEVEDEEIYNSLFDSILMQYYKLVVTEHDELAYNVIPTLQDSIVQSFTPVNQTSEINLLFLNVGESAKLGFTTLWSILRFRTQALRIFVLGDAAGIEDWKANLRLLENSGKMEYLKALRFEYLDFTQHRNFQIFMREYPSDCDVNEIGEALLARFICHDLLPPDVHRVIAMDLADVLVLDDIKDLWAQFDTFEAHHVFAAAHITALSHVNGGLALYDLTRMKASNWTSIALKAARDGFERRHDCIHDQSLMNTIHLHRPRSDGLSPMKTLPCRWMLVPATDWQMFWNSPEMVLPEVRERRRYPGLVSASHFEVYCPDPLDLLSGWTFLLSTSDTKRRLRTMSLLKGNQPLTQCSRDGTAGFVHPRDVPRSRCCECGEKVSLVHIPGDMKQWAFVDILFRYHSPFTDWQEKELQTSLTRKLWQKETRFAEQSRAIQESAGKMAELYGGEICFKRDEKRCCTAHNSLRKEPKVLYKTLNMKPLPPPFRLEVDSTAVADGHLLIGAGPWNSAEIVFGANGGTFSAIRWLSEGSYTSLTAFDGSPQKDASPSKTWKVQVELEEDGRLGVRHGLAEWGFYVPDNFLEILRQSPVQIYVGVPGDLDATWTVCREDLSKQKKPCLSGVLIGAAHERRSGLDQPVWHCKDKPTHFGLRLKQSCLLNFCYLKGTICIICVSQSHTRPSRFI
ncbi:unnamed protein product [Cladocopium goreaui]|uniref:Calcium-binding protein 1 n=1 Tax=Cladocopium goreaui TaxID=2562237 RepID=A0A9P1DTL4_9DINO|nr:unnamed protein product [Cladocopium goreaui]